MSTPAQVVESFLAGWKPFAELPRGLALPGQMLAFLNETRPEERRRHFAAASDLYRLHERFRTLGIFREEKNEKADGFETLFALSLADLAAAIEARKQKELLGLLQFCFEFGRHEAPPRQYVLREFISHLFDREIHAPGLKYSLYAGGLLYTGGGKTHDEMAADFARFGLGGGRPVAGGEFVRTDTLAFRYDLGSSAFRAAGDPLAVKEALLKGIRSNGGRDDLVTVELVGARPGA